MPKLTHLHVHSDASLRDGLGSVERLVQAAANKGFNALALTDHGTLANAVSFSLAARDAGIKPILGLEAYVKHDGQVGHFTLLADGVQGWRNIVHLNNLGQLAGGRSPAFSVDDLVKYNEGIVLLTGCSSSPLHNIPDDEALALASRLAGVFGRRMFAEIMFVYDKYNLARIMWLAKRVGLRLVLTNDVHFPYAEDATLHPILTQMKAGYQYDSDELWLKDVEDILPLIDETLITREQLYKAADMSVVIGDYIGTVELARDPLDVLPKVEDAHVRLEELAMAGARERGLVGNEVYMDRMYHELEVIKEMRYSSYFVILKQMIDAARRLDVRVGPGRGSGVGSVVLWLLDITTIDPIRYELSFERFLNKDRDSMPDVDIDFASESRDRLLEYAKQEWGALPIATYSRYSHRSLVHDLSKTLRMPRGDEETLKNVERDTEPFSVLAASYPNYLECYDAFIGQIRHRGKHAGGVVIAQDSSIVPLERIGDDVAAAWSEGRKNELSYAGFVKFDLLGLAALSILDRLEKKFGRRAEPPTDGHEVFELFREGKLTGVFQFSGSDGIRDLTMRLQPTQFSDLVALNALYRPGALGAGTADKYIEWRDDPRTIMPLINDIIAPTYGVVVYQEQLMAIIYRITDCTLTEADAYRHMMAKPKRENPHWVEKMDELHARFIRGAQDKGMSEHEARELWEELEAHSRYSFNKAHATAYSYIAWEMAWWKYYYPSHFYCAMLNVDPKMAQSYIVAAVRDGIDVRTPHVNRSGIEYTADDDAIYIPLSQIKYMGDKGAEVLVSARGDEPFTTIKDFMKRVPKRYVRANARKGLWYLGAFSGVDGTFPDIEAKSDELPTTFTHYDRQNAYLGFVIPDKPLISAIAKEKKVGRLAGVVVESKRKTSSYGPYTVYRLTPHGVFWVREDAPSLKTGEMVSVYIKSTTGKATDIQELTVL